LNNRSKREHDSNRRDFLKSAPLLLANALVIQELLKPARAQAGSRTLVPSAAPGAPSGFNWTKRALLRPDLENSINAKYLSKLVHDSMMVDDM
jgi:hypothetical protein